jgi:RNA polymerase sigma factor (sigma-70 family)
MKNARGVSSRLVYKELFPDREVAIAKALVSKWCGRRRRFGLDDYNDFLQEVLVHWWTVRNRYDSTREASIESYMRSIVRWKLVDLARERDAEKRVALDRADSLDAPVGEDDDETFHDLLEDPIRPDKDLSIDLALAVEKLTSRQKEIYELRAAGESVKAIGEALSIARCTVHDEIRRIQKRFADRGLKDYLHF